jgi:hypothetical protein
MTLCGLVGAYQCLRGTCNLHLHDVSGMHPEDGVIKLFQNVSNHPQVCTVLQIRRPQSDIKIDLCI